MTNPDNGGERPASYPLPGDIDPPLPPTSMLARFGARELDPATAPLLPGQAIRPTVYIGNRLLARRDVLDRAGGPLTAAAERLGLRMHLGEQAPGARVTGTVRLWVEPGGDRPVALDAWQVLQEARSLAGVDAVRGVGLDHLVFSTSAIFGAPYHSANPYHSPNPYHSANPYDAPITQYAMPGYGGTQPVAVVMPPPLRRQLNRPPVVAVLDTGCGRHPWLVDGVIRDRTLPAPDGTRVPVGYISPDPEDTGDLTGPLDGTRDPLAGHGTFISGIVRQMCPDAAILAVRVVQSDGVIAEAALVDALEQVAELARRYAQGDPEGLPVDVVSLSLGYYHESPADAAFDSVLLAVLDELAGLGVAVVASAGNDATRRMLFPAGFAPHPGGPVPETAPAAVPLTSVGALNPDGSVALFSNSGTWVSRWEPGAALVSTLPETFVGGLNPLAATTDPTGRKRRALDPDDFTGGFAVGSGTSYAAPVFAGRVAAELLAQSERPGGIPLTATGAQAVQRGRQAVSASLLP
jgi:hypothetical protein